MVSNFFKEKTYIDLLDQKIFPFVSADGFENRYPTKSYIEFDRKFYDEMRTASEQLFSIFDKTVKNIQKCPPEFLDLMDIPEKLRDYLDIPNKMNLSSYIARLDFVLKDGQLKLIEFNADTPCAIVESYYGNKVACDFFNKVNPNYSYYSDFHILFSDILSKYDTHDKHMAFVCFDDYIEDKATTEFLMNEAKKTIKVMNFGLDVSLVSAYDLQISEDCLMDGNGRKIDFMYRLYPMELLIEETAPDGFPIGVQLMDLCKEGKIVMINPPESILMQTKGLQALIWLLVTDENNNFYTEEEMKCISKYMLPSFFSEKEILFLKTPYVKKPIWGREGNGIGIYSSDGELLTEKNEEYYDDVRRICKSYLYQKFVESPKFKVEIDNGKIEGYLTVSNFVLGGRSSSFFCRLSPDKIAGIEAFWVPLIEKD